MREALKPMRMIYLIGFLLLTAGYVIFLLGGPAWAYAGTAACGFLLATSDFVRFSIEDRRKRRERS
jgi:hypothetical protein